MEGSVKDLSAYRLEKSRMNIRLGAFLE